MDPFRTKPVTHILDPRFLTGLWQVRNDTSEAAPFSEETSMSAATGTTERENRQASFTWPLA